MNKKFGRLSPVSRAENTKDGRARWLCSCDCGGEKTAPASELKKGGTKSCGCLAQEQRVAAARSQCHPTSRSMMYRERNSWENMIARCHAANNRSYPNYGGRGISVCTEWLRSFESFLSDMGARPKMTTLDRIDNDKSYCPENCRWASSQEQANNRRTNRVISIGGTALTVAQWSRKLGIDCSVVHSRLYMGWPERQAVVTPVGARRSHK